MPEFTSTPFILSREFNAPRELVFKAWTDPEHMIKWWGPAGFTMHIAQMELRPGGVFHYSMTTPDGNVMWGIFTYREVTPPERLVFVNAFADADGNPVRNPWMNQWPLEVLSTVIFTESNGKTTLEMHAIPINATQAEADIFGQSAPSMHQGWKGTLDQLEAYLKG